MREEIKKMLWASADKLLKLAELAKTFGLSTRSIERNLQKLQKEGRLRRIGPQNGGYWEVVQ
jgi:DeoR/GlpR family transcriptional regulator of sugar metabolism